MTLLNVLGVIQRDMDMKNSGDVDMKLICLLFGHIWDKPEIIENIIPYTEVTCLRCGKTHYTTAR